MSDLPIAKKWRTCTCCGEPRKAGHKDICKHTKGTCKECITSSSSSGPKAAAIQKKSKEIEPPSITIPCEDILKQITCPICVAHVFPYEIRGCGTCGTLICPDCFGSLKPSDSGNINCPYCRKKNAP